MVLKDKKNAVNGGVVMVLKVEKNEKRMEV